MSSKFKSLQYPMGVAFAWLTSIGVLTTIFTDIEKHHRREDKALLMKLEEQNNILIKEIETLKSNKLK